MPQLAQDRCVSHKLHPEEEVELHPMRIRYLGHVTGYQPIREPSTTIWAEWEREVGEIVTLTRRELSSMPQLVQVRCVSHKLHPFAETTSKRRSRAT